MTLLGRVQKVAWSFPKRLITVIDQAICHNLLKYASRHRSNLLHGNNFSSFYYHWRGGSHLR